MHNPACSVVWCGVWPVFCHQIKLERANRVGVGGGMLKKKKEKAKVIIVAACGSNKACCSRGLHSSASMDLLHKACCLICASWRGVRVGG